MAISDFFSILKNTSATVLIRGAFGLARVVILLLIAQQYGPTEFGRLALVLPVVEVLKIIADFGLDIISIRKLATNTFQADELMGSILGAKIVLSVAGMFCAPLVFMLIYQDVPAVTMAMVLAPSILTGLLTNAFTSYFQARRNMQRIILAHVAGVVAFASLAALGMVMQFPLAVVAAAIPVGELFTLLLVVRIYLKERHIRLDFNLHRMGGLLREGLYVAVGGIIVVIYLRLDHLMIGGILGETSVGEYAVGYRIMEPFLLVFSSLSLAFYASLSASTHLPHEQRGTTRHVLFSVISIAVVGAVVLSTLVPQFLPMIWNEYAAAGRVLAVLGWTLIPKALNTQMTAILNSLGKFRIITIIAAVNLVVSVILNLLLLPQLGITGAALTVLIVESMNTLMQYFSLSYVTNNALGKRMRLWTNIFMMR